MDIELYNFVKEQFQESVNKLQPEFEKKLKRFQFCNEAYVALNKTKKELKKYIFWK